MGQVDARLRARRAHVAGAAGQACGAAPVGHRVPRLGQVMQADADGLAGAGEEAIRVAEREGGQGEGRAPGRRPRIVGEAGDPQRGLGARVVGLEMLVADRPVLGDPVESAQPEVTGVEPNRVALPVKGAPADTARAAPHQGEGDAASRGVGVEPGQQGLPWVLALDEAARVLGPPIEVVPRARLQDRDLDPTPAELRGHDAAGGARADDADLGAVQVRGLAHLVRGSGRVYRVRSLHRPGKAR
jgi:hypothetical protein